MGRPWRLIRSGAGAPAWNLACDRALLQSDDTRPVLRLYAWAPAALSLGHFQPLAPFEPAASAAGVPIVRRPTGGGAIHHDRELTFCLVATPGRDGYPADVVGAYRRVHDWVAAALADLGARLVFRGDDAPLSVRPRDATLCFEETTALDLVDPESGRKLVGSAQRRSHGRVMHHGSIPLEVPALSPGSGALSELLPETPTWEVVAESLVDHFSTIAVDGLTPGALTAREVGLIDELLAGGFASPEG